MKWFKVRARSKFIEYFQEMKKENGQSMFIDMTLQLVVPDVVMFFPGLVQQPLARHSTELLIGAAQDILES